jgi:predicted PurR-regulated permease PerM
MAGWAWRLLLLAVVVYLVARVLARLYLVVLPFVGSLFVVALLLPVVNWLRARGVPRALATAGVLLAGLVGLGLIAWFVTDQVTSQYSDLVNQLSASLARLNKDLTGPPFHLHSNGLEHARTTVTHWLEDHRGTVAAGLVTGVSVVSEALVGVVLAFFTTFFLLYDGTRIWAFLTGLLPVGGRARADGAGASAWRRITGYVRGTFLIACFHGLVMGITLAAAGVPLAAPLALLVFLGSFIPIVGVVVFGGLAVLVTFGTKGLVLALVVTAVLVLANQVESHLLQPFLVGRYVHLHPLAVALSITAGGVLAGIIGAILAVPIVSVVDAVVRSLAQSPDEVVEPAGS